MPPTVPAIRRPFDNEVFRQLCSLQTMDSLAAFVLMVREASILGSSAYRQIALQGYRRQMPWLRADDVFAPIAMELSDLIDYRFMDQVFVHLNQRLNTFIVTKNMTDEDLSIPLEIVGLPPSADAPEK